MQSWRIETDIGMEGEVMNCDDVEFPPLDITNEDRAKAISLFDGRPTSLVTTREGQDAFMLKAMTELVVRERQLLSAIRDAQNAQAREKRWNDRLDTSDKKLAELEAGISALTGEHPSADCEGCMDDDCPCNIVDAIFTDAECGNRDRVMDLIVDFHKNWVRSIFPDGGQR